jgi:hypothetical protein
VPYSFNIVFFSLFQISAKKSDSNEKNNKPPKWSEGDMLWAKVPGHPWWPCIVTMDTSVNHFVRISRSKFLLQSFCCAPVAVGVHEPHLS